MRKNNEVRNYYRADTLLTHRIQIDAAFSKMRENSLAALVLIFKTPVITISELAAGMGKTYNTAANIIAQFIKAGILIEETKE